MGLTMTDSEMYDHIARDIWNDRRMSWEHKSSALCGAANNVFAFLHDEEGREALMLLARIARDYAHEESDPGHGPE